MKLKRFAAAALAAVMCAFSLPVSAADFAEKTSDIKAHTYNITDATTIQRIAGKRRPKRNRTSMTSISAERSISLTQRSCRCTVPVIMMCAVTTI